MVRPSPMLSANCSWLPLQARCVAQTLPVAVAETGGAGGEEQRGVVPGAAVPAGADPGALLDGAALRVAFPAPAPGQVQEFDGVRRHREDGGQFVELVGRGAVVGERCGAAPAGRRRAVSGRTKR